MQQDFGIFIETFRPKKLNGLVLPGRIRKLFQDEKVTQHFIFHSNQPGLGKTSLCHILAKNYTSLYIDASSEGAIDTLRGPMTNFITSSSLLDDNADNGKIIILDELDGASSKFFEAFRGFIEKYSHLVKFVATCNNLSKIPEPIRASRFEVIPFYPLNEEEELEIKAGFHKRLKAIFSSYLKMKISDENISLLIDKSFPDMRRMMNTVQRLYTLNLEEVTESDIVLARYSYHDIFDMCLDTSLDSVEVYKQISSRYNSRTDDIINSLGDEFISYLMETESIHIKKISEIISVVNEASYKRNFVIDPMVNLLSCLFTIKNIIKGT